MAIYNLSGNFQPSVSDKGINLPQPSSRASSVSTDSVKGSSDIKDIQTSELTKKKVSLEESEAINEIEEFKQFNQSINRSLQFKIDDELGVTIVRIVDKETDQLIRQFPPEELINLSKRLKELNTEDSTNSGVLLQEKV